MHPAHSPNAACSARARGHMPHRFKDRDVQPLIKAALSAGLDPVGVEVDPPHRPHLAIDSRLRGCDVIAKKVEDVAPSGYPFTRATVRQRKTGRPVRFELTEQTRQAVDDYLKVTSKVAGGFLFTSRRRPSERFWHIASH